MTDWIEPPVFAAGEILSASKLNTLSNNVDFLRGIAQAPNVPWLVKSDPFQAVVMHRLPSLYVQYNGGAAGVLDSFQILYQHPTEGDVEVYLDDPVTTGINTVEIDLSGLGLTIGELYVVTVTWTYEEGYSSGAVVYWMAEGPAS